MLALSHCRPPIRHIVQETDDGVGANLLGPPETVHPVPILCGGLGGRVAGDTPVYTTQH